MKKSGIIIAIIVVFDVLLNAFILPKLSFLIDLGVNTILAIFLIYYIMYYIMHKYRS